MTTTAKQARHSHFQRGSGVFECRVCGTRSRDTGDNGDLQLCPLCYDIAGYENQFSDNGHALDDGATKEVRRLFEELVARLHSPEAARRTAPELYDYVLPHNVQAAAEVVLDKLAETPTEQPSNERTYVVVGFDAQGEIVLVCVSARSNGDAKRQGRKAGIVEEAHARRA